MRGIILAGGTGSRLGPLSRVTNKHLLPVGSVPMIFYPISQMLENNIVDICIVSGLFHLGSVVELLGSGSRFSCNFTYKVQDKAGGIAEALLLCKDFSKSDDVSVILGDNIFSDVLDLSLNKDYNTKFFLKEVKDPERFGVAEVDHMKKLIDIEEKPKNPKSNLAVTGAYVYSKDVWDACQKIKRSRRGELEISDVNKQLISQGKVDIKEIAGWWSDAGTQDSFRKANAEIWENLCSKLSKRIEKMARM